MSNYVMFGPTATIQPLLIAAAKRVQAGLMSVRPSIADRRSR